MLSLATENDMAGHIQPVGVEFDTLELVDANFDAKVKILEFWSI